MKDIYFISGNKGKILEFKNIIPFIKSKDIDINEIQSLEAKEILKDKILKVYNYFKSKKIKFDYLIVEDTSLYIKALNNFPGPFIKFFLKSLGSKKICSLIGNFKDNNAYATCNIVIIDKNKKLFFYEGKTLGKISRAPKGKNGFGWDNIFIPKGANKTFAQMTLEEKNKFSMRKKAILKLKKHLDMII